MTSLSWHLLLSLATVTLVLLSRSLNALKGKVVQKIDAFALRIAADDLNLPIMVNGLPGLMALEAAKACIDRGHTLLPVGFTGGSGKIPAIMVEGSKGAVNVKLVAGPGLSNTADQTLQKLKEQYPKLIVIDYTHPSATINNLQSYVENGCDFVMGTTGGDQEKMLKLVESGSILAVIAPNMAKQIVAMQAALLEMSNRFPNSFQDYTLTVTESHQSTKADTSGTAKAIVAHLSKLTENDFSFEEIVKLRDEDSQVKFGVPAKSLGGHAFHTYCLKSSDGSVTFELQHNVCGRRVYAEGTIDAVEFIAAQRATRTVNAAASSTLYGKKLFSMVDVLESGSML